MPLSRIGVHLSVRFWRPALGGYAALSFLAARLGRRAAMATVLSIGLGADAALICSTLVAPWLEVPLFALWLISSSFSQAPLVGFVANIYIVDLVHEDIRYAAILQYLLSTYFFLERQH